MLAGISQRTCAASTQNLQWVASGYILTYGGFLLLGGRRLPRRSDLARTRLAGAAYLPITAGFAVAGGTASQLVTRIGTRPVVVAGCLIAGAGIYYVSRVPLHGSYVSDLLPGFVVMSLGAGSVFVSVTAAGRACPDRPARREPPAPPGRVSGYWRSAGSR